MAATRARDPERLLARVREVQATLEGEPRDGVHALLRGLRHEAEGMGLDLCEFVKVVHPPFLPYYYLLEDAAACDDPAIPLWVREQVRAATERAGFN